MFEGLKNIATKIGLAYESNKFYNEKTGFTFQDEIIEAITKSYPKNHINIIYLIGTMAEKSNVEQFWTKPKDIDIFIHAKEFHSLTTVLERNLPEIEVPSLGKLPIHYIIGTRHPSEHFNKYWGTTTIELYKNTPII